MTYYWNGVTTTQLTANMTLSEAPQISFDGDAITWINYTETAQTIYYWNGETVQEILSLTNSETFMLPYLTGHGVIWVYGDGVGGNIFMWDGEQINAVTTSWDVRGNIAIDGSYVAFSRRLPGQENSDMFLWDQGENVITQMTQNIETAIYSMTVDEARGVIWTTWDRNDDELYYWDGTQLQRITDDETNDSAPAFQQFENGYMVWLDGDIFAVTQDGLNNKYPGLHEWAFYTPDTWNGEAFEYNEPIPEGLIFPQRGFGWAWYTNPHDQRAFGFATASEQAYTAIYQDFGHGKLASLPD